MKTKTSILAATVAAALASVASAQINPDPTGINLFTNPSAYNAASYQAKLGNVVGGLQLYFASNSTAVSAEVSSWAYATQSSDLGVSWLANGGTVKTIFLGESAGELNDFGYISSSAPLGNVNSYKPLATDIAAPATLQSGQEALVHYGAGEKVDFWLNNPGTFTQYGPGFEGGTYFSFLLGGVGGVFAGGDPYTHVRFKWTSVDTEYIGANGQWTTGLVDTLLVSFEDLRGPVVQPGGQPLPVITPVGDADYTDFIVAFQFLPSQAVPEPSTYGLMGAAALLGLVGYRRFKAAKKA